MATEDQLTANLASAVGAENKAPKATKRPAKNATASAVEVEATEGATHLPPPQPGAPCQVKGCPGRYSILQTTKVDRVRLRKLICRTCNHQPAEPHKSAL